MVKVRELPESERIAIKHLSITRLPYSEIGKKLDEENLQNLNFSKILGHQVLCRKEDVVVLKFVDKRRASFL